MIEENGKKHPDDVQKLYYLIERNRYQMAESILGPALVKDPNNLELQYISAIIEKETDRIDESEKTVNVLAEYAEYKEKWYYSFLEKLVSEKTNSIQVEILSTRGTYGQVFYRVTKALASVYWQSDNLFLVEKDQNNGIIIAYYSRVNPPLVIRVCIDVNAPQIHSREVAVIGYWNNPQARQKEVQDLVSTIVHAINNWTGA